MFVKSIFYSIAMMGIATTKVEISISIAHWEGKKKIQNFNNQVPILPGELNFVIKTFTVSKSSVC